MLRIKHQSRKLEKTFMTVKPMKEPDVQLHVLHTTYFIKVNKTTAKLAAL